MQQADPTIEDAESPGNPEQLQAIDAALTEHFEKLMRDARVFAHSLRVPGDRENGAQDAVQAAAETAVNRAGSYDLTRPAYPWLRKLVFNQLRTQRGSAIRARKRSTSLTDAAIQATREQRVLGEDVSEFSEDDLLGWLGVRHEDPDPSDEEQLDRMLAPLSASDQEVLRLAYVNELSGAELAAHFGCTEGTAYTRLSRARDRLRQAFQPTGYGEN